MRTLHHFWLCPFSRKVRIVLAEKELDFELKFEKFWERRDEFLGLNPAGQVPVLVEPDGTALSESGAICEYLDETFSAETLLGPDARSRAETRRLVAWFDLKFYAEVTQNLVDEKVLKRFMNMGEPNSDAMRAGRQNVGYHLDYIAYLADRRNWLAGDDFSLADIAAEKSGIIKAGVPVVVSRQPAAVERVIRDVAKRLRAPIRSCPADWRVRPGKLEQEFIFEDRMAKIYASPIGRKMRPSMPES